MLTRRTVIQGLAAAGVLAAAMPGLSMPALAQSVSASDLAVPGPLGDVGPRQPDAKVTIYRIRVDDLHALRRLPRATPGRR